MGRCDIGLRSWEFECLNFQNLTTQIPAFITFNYQGQQFVMLQNKQKQTEKTPCLHFNSLLYACNYYNIGTTLASFGSVVLCVCARKCEACVRVATLESVYLKSHSRGWRCDIQTFFIPAFLLCWLNLSLIYTVGSSSCGDLLLFARQTTMCYAES